MKIRFVIVLCFLILTGCAAPYTPPQGPNIAKLRIHVPQNELFASVRIMGYSSGQCDKPMSIGMIGGIADNSNDKKLNIPKLKAYSQESYIERLIPAEQKYLLSLRGFLPGSICTITTSFVPSINSNYEANFIWDHNKCYLSLDKIVQTKSGAVKSIKEPSIKQEPRCVKGFT